jgi:ketosteroid isomerase-like protein
MKTFLPILVTTLFVAIAVVPVNPFASASDRVTADSLLQMEADFLKAATDRGSAGYMSYYAEDAVELPNGEALIKGKANIGKTMGFLDDKNNHLTWKPEGADVSSSGDLGYTYGTFEFSAVGKDGKPTVEHGKYTSIWKKQKDGSWKVVLDMGNGSSPAQ